MEININEILIKHSPNFGVFHIGGGINEEPQIALGIDDIKVAIKEILEKYTDVVKENVKMSVFPYDMEEWEVVPKSLSVEYLHDEMEEGGEININEESITECLNKVKWI